MRQQIKCILTEDDCGVWSLLTMRRLDGRDPYRLVGNLAGPFDLPRAKQAVEVVVDLAAKGHLHGQA